MFSRKPATDTTAAQPGPVAAAPATAGVTVDAPPPGGGAQPAVIERINVGVRGEAMTRTGLRTVTSGDVLRSGDRFALRVEVDQPAYLYVALAAANGANSVIFPRAGDELVKPGGETRIPAPGQWFKLDNEIGLENLFVYAARRPLSPDELRTRLEDDAAAVRAASAMKKRVSGKGSSSKARTETVDDTSPGGLTSATRGLDIVPDPDAPGAVQDRDVSSMRFRIDHRK